MSQLKTRKAELEHEIAELEEQLCQKRSVLELLNDALMNWPSLQPAATSLRNKPHPPGREPNQSPEER